jgi:hypothetical protein
LEAFDHAQPFWYYLPILFIGMLPWSALVGPLAWQALRRPQRQNTPEPTVQGAVAGFFPLALAWCLIFFSASGCKRPGYITPAMPLAAIILGSFTARLLAGAGQRACRPRVTVITALSSVRATRLASRRVVWTACALGMFVGLLVAIQEMLPAYHRRFSLRDEVGQHADEAASLPVVCYPRQWDGVNFYLSRADVKASDTLQPVMANLQRQNRTLVFVKGSDYLADFLKALPACMEFVRAPSHSSNVVSGIVRRIGP